MAFSLHLQTPFASYSSSSGQSNFKSPPSNSTIFTIPNSTIFTIPALPRLSSSSRFDHLRQYLTIKSSLTVDLPTTSAKDNEDESSKILLEVRGLTAVIKDTEQQILKGVNLVMREGEVHAVMGKNGSGKSTFSKVLAGHPDYEVTGGSIIFKGENLLDMDPEERSLAGLFMSFQSPVEIPGVSNMDFLHMAYNARQQKLGLPEVDPIKFFSVVNPKRELLKMDHTFLNRNVNEGFSGGERKRNEILQLAVLGADVAILDEIDSGLDVDALEDVAQAVNALLTPKNSVIMVTHYQRLLDYIKPKYVHIMEDGRIIKTGDISTAKLLEKEGYKAIFAA